MDIPNLDELRLILALLSTLVVLWCRSSQLQAGW